MNFSTVKLIYCSLKALQSAFYSRKSYKNVAFLCSLAGGALDYMINVLYSGFSYLHEDGLVYDTDRGRVGFESYQMLFTHTPALFWVDNELRYYPAKSVILFTPGHRKYYSSLPGEPYKNDWIRFDTDEEFIENFPVTNVPFSPADPDFVHNLFKLIAWESNSKKDVDDPEMLALFKILFAKLSDDSIDLLSSPYHHELTALRREMMLHPEFSWTVDSMSRRMNLGRTRFQTLYKETFGISPIDDVINARIGLAKDRLKYTTRSISEVAELCGYKSTEHFIRQFSKMTGMTPGNFRRYGQQTQQT